MKSNRRLLSACLVLLCALPAFSVNGENYTANSSQSALSYLRLPASAQAAGLGGAVSAIGDDAACALVNPALVARSSVSKLSASAEELTLDRTHYFAGFLYPLDFYVSALGIGWVQEGVGSIERRDENGILKGEFSDLENTIAFWYGWGITKNLLGGVSGSYHMQELDSARASGFSGDVGIFYQPIEKLNLALVGQNLGWHFKWNTGNSDKLAPSIRVGAALNPYKDLLSVVSDIEWTPGNSAQEHAGVQVNVLPQFCLRTGLQGPNPIQAAGGFGIHYKAFALDYSYTYHQSGLGNSHLFSVVIAISK